MSGFTGRYGATCVVLSGNHPCLVECDEAIETASGSGSFGSFVLAAATEAVVDGPTMFTFSAPRDGKKRRLRMRCVRDGATPSSYTPSVEVLPWGSFQGPKFPRRLFPIVDDAGVDDGYPARASALDGDLDANIDGDTEVQGGSLYLEDDQSLPVGTIATPSTIEKPLRIPAAAFVPATDLVQYQFVSSEVRPRALNATATMWAPIVIPDGVTIVQWAARINEDTGGVVTLTLRRLTDEFTVTDIGSLQGTSSGWETVSEVLNEDTTGNMYAVIATLLVNSPPGTQTDAAALFEVSIGYDVPDHTKTL